MRLIKTWILVLLNGVVLFAHSQQLIWFGVPAGASPFPFGVSMPTWIDQPVDADGDGDIDYYIRLLDKVVVTGSLNTSDGLKAFRWTPSSGLT